MFFAERDRSQTPEIDDASMDGWDGYAASHHRVTQAGWSTGTRPRPWWARKLVRTSITSTGNCSGFTANPTMAWNSTLKFYNDNRGYVNTMITGDAMIAVFRSLDHVTTPGAPVSTKASF